MSGGAAGPGDPLGTLTVVPIAPALAGDFLALFDRAFPDNPDWSGCYCRFYHSGEATWSSAPEAAARHRAEAAEAIAAGLQPGFLAFAGGGAGAPGARAVGWLSAGPVAAYGARRGYDACTGGADAWTTCFVVEPPARGQGVAEALLHGALAAFREQGLRSVEAFPQKAPGPRAKPRDVTTDSYKGTLGMYLRQGFAIEGPAQHKRVRVRLDL